MKNNKRTCSIIAAVIIFVSASAVDARPVFEITDAGAENSFSAIPVVLFHKGDDPRFKMQSFDDSDWQIVSLPSAWDASGGDYNGIAWYRLHVKFPGRIPDVSAGLELGVIVDADEVYFNGVLIGSSGKISPRRESSYDRKRLYEIPLRLIKPGEENLIALRIAGLFPDCDGPSAGRFRISAYGAMHQQILLEDLKDMIFIAGYSVFSLFFFSFFISRRRDYESLFYSLFSLSVCVYFFMRTQMKYYLDLDFFISKKIEYIVLGLIFVFLMEFFLHFFRRKRIWIHYAFYAVNIIYFLEIFFSSDYAYWSRLNRFFLQPAWIIPLGTVLYVLIKNFRFNTDARYMLGGFTVLLLTFINDVFMDRNLYNFTRVAQYGFFFMAGSLGLILNRRFVRLNCEVEELNINLENKVESRTRELNTANAELTMRNETISETNRLNSRDLMLASRIQRGLVPEPRPDENFDIASYYKPAASVSGDFYDIFPFDNNCIGLYLVDVSGHGLGSALITMMAKPVFFQTFRNNMNSPLREIVRISNERIIEAIGGIDNYMTGVFIRIRDGYLSFVNAGHPPALLYSSRAKKIFDLSSTGMFLGMDGLYPDYKSKRIKINPDDTVILYTDALIESKNSSGEEFGISRIRKILDGNKCSASELKDELVSGLYEFTGSENLRDDLTIIVIKIAPQAD